MPSICKPHVACRVCGAELPAPFLDLGEQPLANALVPPVQPDELLREPRYPLQVTLCTQCGLSQLTVVVDPEVLYTGYRFRSGASEAWVEHCNELAKRCTKEFGDFPPRKVLDIAANDGTQVEAFRRRGWLATGIDPSPAHDAVMVGSWPDAAKYFLPPNYTTPQLFDLVIAQNVLGHVDDPISFLRACKTVLAPEGRVVVEVPNAGDMMLGNAFDTIYHEHLTYWDGWTMEEAAEAAGLQMNQAELLTIHGGSRRYWLAHKGTPRPAWAPSPHRAWHALRQVEATAFAQRVEENLEDTDTLLDRGWPGRMLAWGASAKGAVYMNALARRSPSLPAIFEAIIDDTPEKQGLLLPGVHIPIIACPNDLSDVDILWLLSWNNSAALKEKARAKGFTGKFLLTHPTPRLEE